MNPEQAMAAFQAYLQTYSMEVPLTAKVIAAIPESGRDYKPDEKSKSAIELAHHLCASEGWFLQSLVNGAFAPGNEGSPDGKTFASISESYVNDLAGIREQLKGLTPDKLVAVVDFFGMQFPLLVYVGFMVNHMIHHRGQLSAYIRAAGGRVPSIYGGSADEPFQMSAGA